MKTEADIIYTIWDIVRGGESNQDDPINERLMRAFLRIHRGKILNRAYNEGAEIPDEVFQYISTDFVKKQNHLVSGLLPKLIRFKNNSGVQVYLQNCSVSIVDSNSWSNSKYDRFNKYHPLIKFINNKMFLSTGQPQPNQLDDFSSSSLNSLVTSLKNLATEETIKGQIQAVLVDPDDSIGYDFTSTPYPLPDELIEELINSVNAREFNLFLRVKSDETSDLRNDTKPQDTSQEY